MVGPPTIIHEDNILTTSIQFSWSDATCSSSCPDGITGYIYNLEQVTSGARIADGTTGAYETMVTIRGLTMCTEYSFYVAAVSGSVTGTYHTKSVTTAPGEG